MQATITDSNSTIRMKIAFDGECVGAAEEAFELLKEAMGLISSQPKVQSINIVISC